ncbi:MAG: DUF5011 domain-containing protein [Bacilli bacterium]|nr:DUF5011 domain-containing protein [Bacilli bacterium]
MKDILRYSKKEVIIVLIILLLLAAALIVFFSNSKEETKSTVKQTRIILFGDQEITLEEGERYIEPGFYAITNEGEVKQNEIEVTPNTIDTSVPGTYYISYTYEDKIERRKIVVKEKENKEEDKSLLTLELKGETMISIDVLDEYIEPGYIATDTKDGDISDKVVVSGSVNTKLPGTYTLTYEVQNSSGDVVTKTRKVIVKEGIVNVEITGNTSIVTSENVTLTITIKGNNFSYIKYPNGLVSKERISTYVVDKNGTYEFLIYDTTNNYISKKITISNINKKSSVSQDGTSGELTGTCTATLKDGKTTFKVTSSNAISNYNFNSMYSSSSATYTVEKYIRENNFVVISDRNGNSKKITCQTKLEALPPITSRVSGTIKYKGESDTLKVYIIKSGGFYLSYVWAYDPVNQLFKQYTSGSSKIVKNILEIATKNNNNLKNKYMIGFNASPPVNSKYYTGWNEKSEYKLKEPLPLMIYNGKVLVNNPNKGSDLFIYYLDGSNQLKYTPKVNTLSAADREKLYTEIINSGARNTMTWRPILIDNYKAVTLESSIKTMEAARKQAICQVDSNNFIIITSETSSQGTITYPKFVSNIEKLGCRVAMEFDAGGSTSLVWKARGTNTVSKVAGGGRELTSAMYFTELS